MALHPTRRLFSIAEYHKMAQAGVFGEDDRLELIDGEVTEMTPIGRRHAACVNRLNRLFVQHLGAEAIVSVQNPITLDEHTEPQPDVAILRPRPDFYAARYPTPGDVLLAVEVADTSSDWDRRVKVPLYARSGIVEVWLVDVEQETLTVYQDPTDSGYRAARVLHRGDQAAPSSLGDRPLAVNDILG